MCWSIADTGALAKMTLRAVNMQFQNGRHLKTYHLNLSERMSGLSELYERRVSKKGARIAADSAHMLTKHYMLLPSGCCYDTLKRKTNRSKFTFLPLSITFLNDNMSRWVCHISWLPVGVRCARMQVLFWFCIVHRCNIFMCQCVILLQVPARLWMQLLFVFSDL